MERLRRTRERGLGLSVFFCFIVLWSPVAPGVLELGCVRYDVFDRCFSLNYGVGFRVNTTTASELCRDVDSQLADVESEEVSSIMNNSAGRTGWIRLWLQRYDDNWKEWRIVKNNIITDIITRTADWHQCVSLGQSAVTSENCIEKRAYICSVSSATAGENCVLVSNDTCLVIGSPPSVTWYEARYRCMVNHGGDLAAPARDQLDGLRGNLSWSNGAQYWLGVSNGVWLWHDRREDEPKIQMMYSNWKEDQPKEDKDCAFVDLREGLWESGSCASSEHFICEHDYMVTTASPATATSEYATVTDFSTVTTSMAVPTTTDFDYGTEITETTTIMMMTTTTPTTGPGVSEIDEGQSKRNIYIIAFSVLGGVTLVTISAVAIAESCRRRDQKYRRRDTDSVSSGLDNPNMDALFHSGTVENQTRFLTVIHTEENPYNDVTHSGQPRVMESVYNAGIITRPDHFRASNDLSGQSLSNAMATSDHVTVDDLYAIPYKNSLKVKRVNYAEEEDIYVKPPVPEKNVSLFDY